MSSIQCQRVEVTQEMLKNLKMGDVVTLKLTGTIKEMRLGPDAGLKEESERKGMWESPSCIYLDVANREVTAEGANEFDELAKEENDEADEEMKSYAKRNGGDGALAAPTED